MSTTAKKVRVAHCSNSMGVEAVTSGRGKAAQPRRCFNGAATQYSSEQHGIAKWEGIGEKDADGELAGGVRAGHCWPSKHQRL